MQSSYGKILAEYNMRLVLTIDTNGCANFSSVQKAVDAVPDSSVQRSLIAIDAGTYREKVNEPALKRNLIFQGQGYLNTAIAWDDTVNSSGVTFYSASVFIFAPQFTAFNISFKNTSPRPLPTVVGGQALALRISGDQATFYGCGFYGFQDTLHDDVGRHYFWECFIQGSVDFIFGNDTSLYQHCTLRSVAEESESISGAVTAQGRESEQQRSGFVFADCSLDGTENIWLGRAWRNYSTVVFSRTYMSAIVSPDGWSDWEEPSRDGTIFYREHECFGPGANFSQRASYSKQLTAAEAAQYTDISFIDGREWLVMQST